MYPYAVIVISGFSSYDSEIIASVASPICLPTQAHVHGDNGVVSGWGTTYSGIIAYITFATLILIV